MTMPIRTLVVDDEPAARRRIVRLGGAHPDVRIVGEAGTAADAIELLDSASPDLVFLDIRLPEGDGFEVVDAPEPRIASRRLPIELDGRVLLLDTERIDYVRAERNYVRIHAGRDSHRVRGSLGAMERKLDPARFQRIHRSLIVALDRVEEVETLDHGELALRLRSGAVLVSGRTYTAALRGALGLTAASSDEVPGI